MRSCMCINTIIYSQYVCEWRYFFLSDGGGYSRMFVIIDDIHPWLSLAVFNHTWSDLTDRFMQSLSSSLPFNHFLIHTFCISSTSKDLIIYLQSAKHYTNIVMIVSTYNNDGTLMIVSTYNNDGTSYVTSFL